MKPQESRWRSYYTVYIGYALTALAMGTAAVTQEEPCTSLPGVCKSTSQCSTGPMEKINGRWSCPSSGNDIQCCPTVKQEEPCTSYPGVCKKISQCSNPMEKIGDRWSCPSSGNDIQCCPGGGSPPGPSPGKTNAAGIALIKEFEGWYPNFYKDPVGIRTIGYGHACHVWDCSVPLNGKYPVPLSMENGHNLLVDDLSSPGRYESCVTNTVTYSNLNSNQYSALVSFTFNLGCGNLKSSDLLKLLNRGDVGGASRELGKWVYAGGKRLAGLVRRREAERVLFCSSGGC